MIRRIIESLAERNQPSLLEIAQDYRAVVHQQQDLIARKDAEILELKLGYARWGRDVIENFLIAIERPEIDIRDVLVQAIEDMSDEVARLEEHAPI